MEFGLKLRYSLISGRITSDQASMQVLGNTDITISLFEQCRIGIGNLDDAQCSYMFQRKCCTKYGFTCREEEGQERGFRNSRCTDGRKNQFLMEGGELKRYFMQMIENMSLPFLENLMCTMHWLLYRR